MLRRKFRFWDITWAFTVFFLVHLAIYREQPRESKRSERKSTSEFRSTTQSGRPSIAIFATCNERSEAFNDSLSTWLGTEVQEIVIVDRVQSEPTTHGDPRVKIYAVTGTGEESWSYSETLNIAARLTSSTWLLKLDCSTRLERTFFGSNLVQKGEFRTGIVTKSRILTNEEGKGKGMLFVSRDDFFSVGGYDERIGSEVGCDDDVVIRLGRTGLLRRPVDDTYRGDGKQTPVGSLLEARKWRMMVSKVSPWSRRHRFAEFQVRDNNQIFVPENGYRNPRLETLISPEELENIERSAYVAVLNEAGASREAVGSLNVAELRSLFGLYSRSEKLVIVHVTNGLGNRLRVLASGISIARALSRKMILVWPRDIHCDIEFGDLFTNDFELHNYLQPDQLSDRLFSKWEAASNVTNLSKHPAHWYLRSSTTLKTIHSTSSKDKKSVKSLHIHPDIMNMADKYDVNGAIGVHIRQSDDADLAPKVHEEYLTTDMETLTKVEFWRKLSSLELFRAKIATILETDRDAKFFVATDTRENLNILRKEFPGSIDYMEEACALRTAICIRTALAEMIVLSRTKYLLGSAWSSFTEGVSRFAPTSDFKTYISGRNFTL